MKGSLYLTQSHNKQPTYVDSKIVENLTPYQVDGIRFLYQQCILKKQNVILNNEPGMQEEREICAFLSAIERPAPSLIVCQRHCLSKWYYEFSQANLEVLTADELIKDDSWENSDLPDVVLITQDQLKHIKTLPVQDWSFFIIQHLESLEKSRYIKNVNTQYRIGLVNQSYMDLTPELQWFAMKWANSGLVEEKDKFIESDNFNKTNLLWPFPDYWRRITLKTIQKFQPTLKQLEEYEQTIKKWCKEHKPALLSIFEPGKENQRRPRKRTTTKKQVNKNSSTSKRKRVAPKQNYKKESVSSDSEENENVISYKSANRTIQYSSDSDTQDLDEYQVQEKMELPGKTFKIQSKVMSINLKNVQTSEDECSPSLLDDSKESCILGSLFDSPEPTTSNQITNIKDEPKSLKNNELKKLENKTDVEDNFILNSLVDSPEPCSSKNQKSKEFKISDDENESCPILDLLF